MRFTKLVLGSERKDVENVPSQAAIRGVCHTESGTVYKKNVLLLKKLKRFMI